jgi:para-nitrobenzyl esterase
MAIKDARGLRPIAAGVTALALAVTGVLSFGAGIASAEEPHAMAGAASEAPVVGTGDGPVHGSVEDGLSVFKGVPFAAPPVGDLRFKAPTSPEPWTEPLDATNFGPACAQEYDEEEVAEGGALSEDCLTLNVWSRSLEGNDPVIVFIHGGGFTSGSASNDRYDGADLARRGATVVSIQYRLGPFGWLDLSALGPEYAEGMNNGLKDQMAALKWVRENIGAFGGDAQNVTVTGESAGAISISALMGVPEADDLYDRVIMQSGTAGTVATRD